MRVLCIIPARIGSKGIPEKNLLRIGNYSLVERALFTAIKTSVIDDIIVSTDSQKICDIVNKYGDYAPFLRPGELASDTAGSLGVMQHALEWAEQQSKKVFNYVVLLEPPCPFRLPKHIKTGLKIAGDNQATSVVSLMSVGDYHPVRMKKMREDGSLEGVLRTEPDGLRRQDQEPVYIRNCAVYVFDTSSVKDNRLWGDRPYGFEMDRELYGYNIDELNDFAAAKAYYQRMVNAKRTREIQVLPE